MALHEQSVEEGVEVTLVRLEGDGLIRGYTVGHDVDGRILVHCGPAVINLRLSYSQEGVRWIRRHARDGTPAAEALLAAFKLSRMLE